MKKILFITGSLPPMKCGVGYYSASLLRHLSTTNLEFGILTTAKNDQATWHNVKAPGWKIRHTLTLYDLCKKQQPDIIHLQYPTKGFKRDLGINLLPYLLRLGLRRTKLIVTLHEYSGSPILGKTRDFITILPTHKLVVSNQADFQALPHFLRKKTIIIPLGSSIESTAPDHAEEHGIDSDKQGFASDIILFFGFALPGKQLEKLLKAMPYVKNKRLVVASDFDRSNPYENSLLQLVDQANNNHPGSVTVIGFQPNDRLVALLKSSFCFVLPQSMPLNSKSSSVIAAVRHQLPVIGKKGTTTQNAPFKNGETALLLDELDEHTIATAINELAINQDQYRTIKEQLEVLSPTFGWDSLVQEHFKLYEI